LFTSCDVVKKHEAVFIIGKRLKMNVYILRINIVKFVAISKLKKFSSMQRMNMTWF